jgi:hypothetical protein
MTKIPPYITRRDRGRNNSQEGNFQIPKKSETEKDQLKQKINSAAEAAKASAEEETIVLG